MQLKLTIAALALALSAGGALAQAKPGQPGYIPTGYEVPGPTCLAWDARAQTTVPVRCNDFGLVAQSILQSNRLPGSVLGNGGPEPTK
jgi:hypothetical protein